MMKLSEIKQNPLFPFSDFRTNDASFLMLEMYWTALAFEAIGTELSHKVIPLFNVERDVDRDGSTPNMLMFWIPELQRGARIMLMENTDNLPLREETKDKFTAFYPLMVWLNKNGVYDETHSINVNEGAEQIEIASNISEISERYITLLFRKFFNESRSMAHVSDLWGAIQEKLGYPTSKELEEYYDRVEENGGD